MSHRLKLVIEYDGTDYAGWQMQDNAVTVQSVLSDAFARVAQARVVLHAAGRTDAGVHARGQIVHCDVEKPLSPEKWHGALNANLPPDIRVRSVECVGDDFHARRSAISKRYRYQFWRGRTVSPFWKRYVTAVPVALDWDAMRAASADFTGTHDFMPFSVLALEVATTVRTIFSVTWRGFEEDRETARQQDGEQWGMPDDIVAIDFHGDGFLRYQVRRMVGTLLDIGRHKLPPEAVREILCDTKRFAAGATAPPQGLTLIRVDY
jgi:tRNA pseudouridine38-40 synthase